MTQVLLAYSRTLQIQALYACPLTFSEMPLFLSTGSKLWKFFQAALTLFLLQNSYLIDQWNQLNKRRSLQTYHFRLSFLDHFGKLPSCCQYRHYTGKMDLPLTFLWFSSISAYSLVLEYFTCCSEIW